MFNTHTYAYLKQNQNNSNIQNKYTQNVRHALFSTNHFMPSLMFVQLIYALESLYSHVLFSQPLNCTNCLHAEILYASIELNVCIQRIHLLWQPYLGSVPQC